MRYGVAFIVAAGILLAGALFARQTKHTVLAEFRKSLREAKAAGTLPPELQHLDPETATMEGFGFEIPAALEARIWAADIIYAFWFVLGPLVIVSCLSLAALSNRFMPPSAPAVEQKAT